MTLMLYIYNLIIEPNNVLKNVLLSYVAQHKVVQTNALVPLTALQQEQLHFLQPCNNRLIKTFFKSIIQKRRNKDIILKSLKPNC